MDMTPVASLDCYPYLSLGIRENIEFMQSYGYAVCVKQDIDWLVFVFDGDKRVAKSQANRLANALRGAYSSWRAATCGELCRRERQQQSS